MIQITYIFYKHNLHILSTYRPNTFPWGLCSTSMPLCAPALLHLEAFLQLAKPRSRPSRCPQVGPAPLASFLLATAFHCPHPYIIFFIHIHTSPEKPTQRDEAPGKDERSLMRFLSGRGSNFFSFHVRKMAKSTAGVVRAVW